MGKGALRGHRPADARTKSIVLACGPSDATYVDPKTDHQDNHASNTEEPKDGWPKTGKAAKKKAYRELLALKKAAAGQV